MLDELREANEHCLHVGGYKDATGFRRQPQYFGIWGTIRNHAHVAYKVDAGLPAAETAPDVGIEIRIGLERYLQESFATFSMRARSNGSSISGGNGWLDLNSS